MRATLAARGSEGEKRTASKKRKEGEVAEWYNAADCKFVPNGALVRIQPAPNERSRVDERVAAEGAKTKARGR